MNLVNVSLRQKQFVTLDTVKQLYFKKKMLLVGYFTILFVVLWVEKVVVNENSTRRTIKINQNIRIGHVSLANYDKSNLRSNKYILVDFNQKKNN